MQAQLGSEGAGSTNKASFYQKITERLAAALIRSCRSQASRNPNQVLLLGEHVPRALTRASYNGVVISGGHRQMGFASAGEVSGG